MQAFNRIGAGPRNQDLIVSTAEDGKNALKKWNLHVDMKSMRNAFKKFYVLFSFLCLLVPSSPPRKVQCTPISSTTLLINWSPPSVSEMNGVLKEYRVFYRPLREWEGNQCYNILLYLMNVHQSIFYYRRFYVTCNLRPPA